MSAPIIGERSRSALSIATMGLLLATASCAGSSSLGDETVATTERLGVGEVGPLVATVPAGLEPPDPAAVEAAGEVVARLAAELDEERILAGCPFDDVFDDFNIAGFAEPEGALLCLDGDAATEVLVEGSLVVGATIPEDFEVLLGEDHSVSESVTFGTGELQTACAGAEVCVARWRTNALEVVVIDFVVDDPADAPSLLPEVLATVVEGTRSFDLADVGL